MSCTRSITHEGRSEKDEECNTLSADLLVAADGANSFVRQTLGKSFPMLTHSYDRKAVTCTVELDARKGGNMARMTAFQRFLPHGPIALLPVWNSLNNDQDAPIYANVVWSTTPSEANHLLSLSGTEFIATLNHHLCQGPNVNPSILGNNNGRGMPHIPIIGTIAKEMDSLLRTANTALTMGTWTESPSRNFFRMPPMSTRVVGPIMGFDLKLSHVQQGYTAPRVALVGDAAHTVHPMAGQGLNLGMGDVYSLSELIKEAIDCGMDVGGTGLFLDRYNQERMVKGWGTVGGVHGLHELFRCSGIKPNSDINANALNSGGNASGVESVVGLGRSLGMNIVNSLGPLRRAFAEAAAGAAFTR
jgi:ubiquinone biosynthesis monooxygenase Coq6